MQNKNKITLLGLCVPYKKFINFAKYYKCCNNFNETETNKCNLNLNLNLNELY